MSEDNGTRILSTKLTGDLALQANAWKGKSRNDLNGMLALQRVAPVT